MVDRTRFFDTRGLHRISVALALSALPALAPNLSLAQDSPGLNTDLQLWSVGRLTHVFGNWSASAQYEIRLGDDISVVDERIIKPYLHYTFSDHVGLAFGYKHINRPQGGNEWEPWGELVLPEKRSDFLFAHQFRLEVRSLELVDGVVPRARYLFNYSRRLGETPSYWTGYGAVLFNVANQGMGPVSGLEQVRFYNAIGFHLGTHARLEVGYLYRYERERDKPAKSDHAIHLQLLVSTKHRWILRPEPNDQIR